MNLRSLAQLALLSSIVLPYAAAQATAPAIAASALTAVPPLVPYSGQVEGRTGQTSATFLIYKDQQGGEPLFTESQTISFDQTGHYKVQLGAANPNGLPSALFATGEARWLEVQVAGEAAQPRVLLASVPYALKAADAATLGGLPASAFALAGNRNLSTLAVANQPAVIGPDATSTVTTTGGTSGYLPQFTGKSTIVDSILYATATGIGVGDVPNSSAVFDVNGKSIWRGLLNISRAGNANASTGFNSFPLFFQAGVYNSSTKAAVLPNFQWQAEPINNNTSSPSATFNLLASQTGGTPTETGLTFQTDGVIHFAPGQTFEVESSGLNTPFIGFATLASGVMGGSQSTSLGGAGVAGFDDNLSGTGTGVYGGNTNSSSSTGLAYKNQSHFGAGVWGDSGYPVSFSVTPAVMATADDQYAGIFANSSTNAATLSLFNSFTNPDAPVLEVAGYFGHCLFDTSGDFGCTGTKSAVVPIDNNTRKVALYAVESPENWFEDFGSGQLANGVATVKLEPVFAQTVNAGVGYHVFLTPRGDSKGLYVSRTTSTSFEVRESGSGRSTLAFDYRIVARRKGYEAIRLADKTKEMNQSRSPLIMAAQRAKQTRE